MGRKAKVFTTVLLLLALLAITVPTALNLLPAFAPKHQAAPIPVPAVQKTPTSLSQVQGVAELSASAPVPNAIVLKTALDAALKVDGAGDFSAFVTDAMSGKALYDLNGEALRAPASNLKILTAAAALKSLGAHTRLETSVVQGSGATALVLKGGGDSMLGRGESESDAINGHAGLETLAKLTAAKLRANDVKGAVTVSVDDSLFSGPALSPAWDMIDVNAGEIAPVNSMALYAARIAAGDTKNIRPTDPAMDAANAFVDALQRQGVSVKGALARAKAASGESLATVESATVAQQVQYLLQESDNYVAEVMGRLIANKEKQPSTPDGARVAVGTVLTELGVNMSKITMMDNCGLADGNFMSAHDLVTVMSLIIKNSATDVGQVLPGLPIAGFSGTLGDRFSEPSAQGAAGVVRAKTGTLNRVSALTGYAINSEGRLLVFSFVANGLQGSGTAVPAIDQAAAILAKS